MQLHKSTVTYWPSLQHAPGAFFIIVLVGLLFAPGLLLGGSTLSSSPVGWGGRGGRGGERGGDEGRHSVNGGRGGSS
jgi:hypothetical protein